MYKQHAPYDIKCPNGVIHAGEEVTVVSNASNSGDVFVTVRKVGDPRLSNQLRFDNARELQEAGWKK